MLVGSIFWGGNGAYKNSAIKQTKTLVLQSLVSDDMHIFFWGGSSEVLERKNLQNNLI